MQRKILLNWIYSVPILLGIAAVVQGGLNSRIVDRLGISLMTVLNSVTLVATSAVIYGLFRLSSAPVPNDLAMPEGSPSVLWWYLIPGVLGYTLVAGIPWTIGHLGATKTFLTLIAMQLMASVIWDHFFEDSPINVTKVLGVVVAFVGALLATR